MVARQVTTSKGVLVGAHYLQINRVVQIVFRVKQSSGLYELLRYDKTAFHVSRVVDRLGGLTRRSCFFLFFLFFRKVGLAITGYFGSHANRESSR